LIQDKEPVGKQRLIKLYYPNKVKDHPIKTLIDFINGMVE
jgi:hypothetical protein